jgi:hypothetical protein
MTSLRTNPSRQIVCIARDGVSPMTRMRCRAIMTNESRSLIRRYPHVTHVIRQFSRHQEAG